MGLEHRQISPEGFIQPRFENLAFAILNNDDIRQALQS